MQRIEKEDKWFVRKMKGKNEKNQSLEGSKDFMHEVCKIQRMKRICAFAFNQPRGWQYQNASRSCTELKVSWESSKATNQQQHFEGND